MKRGFLLALAASLFAAGAWQVGGGVYIHAKALLAQQLLSIAWADTQAGERQARPWAWADTWPVARLRIDRLGVDHIVLAGATGPSLAFGPGHMDGTAAPGDEGVSIVGGHRDTHFRFLQDLIPGDEIVVERPDGTIRTYRVRETQVVHKDLARIAQTQKPVLVLSTCWPFDAIVPGGPMRYLVAAEGVEEIEVAAR